MGLPGCLWFSHLSGEEQVGLADIVKYLGLCTWYSLGDWKMGHMPLWFADTLPSDRQHQPPKPTDRTGCNVYALNGGPGLTHFSVLSFLSPMLPSTVSKYTHWFLHYAMTRARHWKCREKELLVWNMRKPEQRQARRCGGRNLGFRVRPTWVWLLALLLVGKSWEILAPPRAVT